ncbi:MAG: sulfite reductase flavoprotein subunit alpha [Chitinophagaceae bacterium]|nr:sulfite reductase flavoprotein subunit alpha [Chitinophagaceae bacterium]MCU0382525.1 sulfite reductase flavoprotein subunit alpha [Cyclobacteriaceae bacterium]
MLSGEKLVWIDQLTQKLTHEEILWVSGYLAGYSKYSTNKIEIKQFDYNNIINIIYATETGNSKKAAGILHSKLRAEGIKARIVAADNYNNKLLEKESHVVIVISTQGEGEPPEQGRQIYNYLHQRKEPLENLNFGIIALGSKSYPLFCQAGIDIEQQLIRLKAHKITHTALCEEDYEPVVDSWVLQLIKGLNLENEKPIKNEVKIISSATEKKDFQATLGVNIRLNDRDSNKVVHHLEFDLAEDIPYAPGNAVGFIPENEISTVEEILKITKTNHDELIISKGVTYPVTDYLKQKVNITYLTTATIKKLGDKIKSILPEKRTSLLNLLEENIDLCNLPIQEVCECLSPITPRLYTIASSPQAHIGQIHLTVALHEFESDGKIILGRASANLQNMELGRSLNFFIHRQKSFQLPADDKNIILIGWGTGIAPFRSFIAERAARQSQGKTWLIFSEENRTSDFYYQTELQNWQAEGVISKMQAAFSKSVSIPKNLKDVILENKEEIMSWVDKGGYIFISGLKIPTGEMVENALVEIVQSVKESTKEDALVYLKDLSRDGRFAKELY